MLSLHTTITVLLAFLALNVNSIRLVNFCHLKRLSISSAAYCSKSALFKMESFNPITDESVDVSISSELSYLAIWSDVGVGRKKFSPKDYEHDARIEAVQRDDVKFLIKLPESSGWFKFKESKTGNTLLHISIMAKSANVCDYLLSIPDFPLDEKNNENLTALDLCMELPHDFCDRLASDLVEKGASTDSVLLKIGDTFLHHSIEFKVRMSKMLMEKGHDINTQNHKGETPLWKCVRVADQSSIWRPHPREREDQFFSGPYCT